MAISTKTNKTMVKGGGDDEELDSDFYNFARKSSKKFVDPVVLTELGELWSMAAPITLMNCVVFLRAMVSVLFLGRLGPLALAGGALSIGFTNITGYSVLFGLASGLEPLCSQAYGSGNYEMLSLSLQRAFLLLFLAAMPISILWLNLGPIMVGLGQDLEITATAASFCLYSLPDLLTYIALQPLRVYLRSQGVTKPMAACSAAAVVLHVPLNFFLVFVLGLGVPGVAIASALTNFNMLMFLLIYLWWTGTCKLTWCGWASPATVASGVAPLVKLAVPSCLSVCLEWWWYEIMTVLAGYLPDPTTSVGAAAVLIQTTSLMYTVPMALAACVSTRAVFFYNKGGIPMVVHKNLSSVCIVTGLLVSNIQCYQMVGNELGAGKPSRARMAAMVALGCALVIGVIHVIWTFVFREQWVRLFTNDASIVRLASAVMPLMGLCELGNCPQSTGCGVLRGTARPAVGARINLFSFYLVGLPVAVSLAFGANVGFSGLWYGLFSAQVACVVLILIAVLVRTDWELEASRARKLTNVEIAVVNEEMKGLMGDTNTEV